jgi:hypothetical protein
MLHRGQWKPRRDDAEGGAYCRDTAGNLPVGPETVNDIPESLPIQRYFIVQPYRKIHAHPVEPIIVRFTRS